jgi:hypothetical protein
MRRPLPLAAQLGLSLRQFVDKTLRGPYFGCEGELRCHARIDGSNSEAGGETISGVHGRHLQ